jgi:hypothetical protein
MTEPAAAPPGRCPWCSAELPSGAAANCPSCGATLTSADSPEPDIRGVTTLDPEAILRARSESSRPRGRLLSFITGETGEPPLDAAELASFAPPDLEVRREMLRLQLEAERASLEAETVALRTDVILEQGIVLEAGAETGDAAGEGPDEAEGSASAEGAARVTNDAATDDAPADGATPDTPAAIPSQPPLPAGAAAPPPPPPPGTDPASDR